MEYIKTSKKLTYKETPKMKWRNNRSYKIQDGFIMPVEEKCKSLNYYPFDLYEKQEMELKYSKSPHQIFANIDIGDNKNIEEFYKNFGPLGFYERDVITFVQPNSKSSKGLPIIAIVRDSINRNNNFRQLSLEDLKKKYHITDKIVEKITTNDVLFQTPCVECIDRIESIKEFLKEDDHDVYGDKETLDPDDILHEIPEIDSFDAWESLEDFKEAHEKFNWIMNLNNNLEQKNIQKLKELLLSDKAHVIYDTKEVNETIEEQVLSEASKYIYFNIITQLNDTVSIALNMDELKNKLSRNIIWKCKSLITAMWLMLLLDITKSKFNVKCSCCGDWFYSERSHGLYCTPACKHSANTETQIYKAESLKKDSAMNLLRQGKSIEDVRKSESIRKKTIEKWINENVEV